LDDEGVRDIADVVETDQNLYNEDEVSHLNQTNVVQVGGAKDVKLDQTELEHLQYTSSAAKGKAITLDEDGDFARE
jgi:hypothetical protein